MGSLFINDDLSRHSAVLGSLSQPTKQDPHRYQHGFGNHHMSEAFSGAIPRNGTNIPQRHPYSLYAEHLNGTSFVSSRETVSNVYVTFAVLRYYYVLQPYDIVLIWMSRAGGCIESDLR